jgi:hypothetical protein
MVREQVYRQKKYEAKVVGDVVKARIDALKEVMAEQTSARFGELASIEESVKKNILEPAGVPSIQIPFYLNIARELYSKSRVFTGETLKMEAHMIANKWIARGLRKDLVNQILTKFGVPPLPE